jgi:hypothetical protein
VEVSHDGDTIRAVESRSGGAGTTRRRLAFVLLIVSLVPSAGFTQTNFGTPPGASFRVTDTKLVERRSGPAIAGYVRNDTPNILVNVRLHVSVIDAAGTVVSESEGVLPADIPAFGRGYFEIPLKATGARYDVTVIRAEPLPSRLGRDAVRDPLATRRTRAHDATTRSAAGRG